jgi:hypothetical protein
MAQPQETPELRSLRSGGIAAQPLRIETTRRVVLNTMFKKPDGRARFFIYGECLREWRLGGAAVRALGRGAA